MHQTLSVCLTCAIFSEVCEWVNITGKNLREKACRVVPVQKIKRAEAAAEALLSEVSFDLQKNASRNFYKTFVLIDVSIKGPENLSTDQGDY